MAIKPMKTLRFVNSQDVYEITDAFARMLIFNGDIQKSEIDSCKTPGIYKIKIDGVDNGILMVNIVDNVLTQLKLLGCAISSRTFIFDTWESWKKFIAPTKLSELENDTQYMRQNEVIALINEGSEIIDV